MIVYIPKADCSSDLTGKDNFCNILANKFRLAGIDVTGNSNVYVDVSLSCVNIKHSKSKKKILRLDGIYHDKKLNYTKKNRIIADSLGRADGVIYQSNFSKNLCDSYIGKCSCIHSVIYNGSEQMSTENKCNINTENKKVFITFSKWRPHKRLLDTIRSFLLANIKDSVLIVAGDFKKKMKQIKYDKYFNKKNIIYVGHLSQLELSSYLKIAVANIHLCWFDNCPNDVVESIAAGVPTITNNVGGTRELIKLAGGIICDIDKPYTYNPVDLYNPPKINRRIVADAIVKCSKNKIKVDSSALSMDTISKQYLSFFNRVILEK